MKILLTGATGYVGRRLLDVLLSADHEVVCLVRDPERLDLDVSNYPNITLYKGDLLAYESLLNLDHDFDVAFFLVHAMHLKHKGFESLEEKMAHNFTKWIDQTHTSQIIYLSAIVNSDSLSPHLSSRLKVEQMLKASSVPATVLRAAIIVGSGSASFEIIRDLVEKLPVMVAPKWVKTRCQPIGIRNVLEYLVGVMQHPDTLDQTFDIGGPDIMTYEEILMSYASIRGLKRYIINVPVLTPRLSSYWLYFVTSTSYDLSRSLVESMKNEVICNDNRIQQLVPVDLQSFEEMIRSAFDKIKQHEVVSSWSDALSSSRFSQSFSSRIEAPKYGCFKDVRERYFKRNREEVIENVWNIGGETGWYSSSILWKIRGFMDKIVGGVGLNRGKRNDGTLHPGDAVDFWRVIVADKETGKLLLFAEMKMPGEAWLEFDILQDKKGYKLVQTATYRPRGLAGRLYWYLVFPFHELIFPRMIQKIVDLKHTPNSKTESESMYVHNR